ncbi:MAG: hypothetical protein PF961_08080 [Planctomycetota bacterium]|nr:hypothetical protein [Planctomycetota bacterium]
MPATASASALDHDLIRNPPARLRGTPFWSWNHDLSDHQRLRDQIDALGDMGMGGVHLHSRMGLQTAYLSDEWFDAVRVSHEHCRSRGMLTWLYDEDTWPSGFAGGLVGRELRYRQRTLCVRRHDSDAPVPEPVDDTDSDAMPLRRHLASWRIELDADGYLLAATPAEAGAHGADIWSAWIEISPDNSRYNGGGYLDALNPAAVDAFISCTHERYLAAFGGSFPDDVPAIFTDEPQYARHRPLADPRTGVARFPWTDDLPTSYHERFGADLIADIPDLVWSRREAVQGARWRFFDHVTERFVCAFADRIGTWCEQHGIALTGHMMQEPSLRSQIGDIGEAMRHYRGFQIPGIDMLCDQEEFTTAKQAASAARQDGRAGVLSELYGVTDWDFPFAGHKRQGDWQAALGVTVRVHHLTWLSMAGDAKRDYPASIGPHMPWCHEYPVIEDHFARVGAALTQGQARVRLAVVHPIEGAWLQCGPQATDGIAFNELDDSFQNLTRWLVDQHVDFDFICESRLPEQSHGVVDGRLQIGAMAYDAVLVPNMRSIRSTTLAALSSLQQAGGGVVVAGELPQAVDGVSNAQAVDQALRAALRVPWSQSAILAACETWREVAIRAGAGEHTESLYQLRELGTGERVLFACDRRRSGGALACSVRVRGEFSVAGIDTASGESQALPCQHSDGWTTFAWTAEPSGHCLVHLQPGSASDDGAPAPCYQVVQDCPRPQACERDEANVLLLDRAEWALNDEPWQPRCDVMITHRALVQRFAWPSWCQPWTVSDAGPVQRLRLRFPIECSATVVAPRLALERAAETTIRIDGVAVTAAPAGYWVDPCFSLVALPDLAPGQHVIELDGPVDALRRPEWCYLLHDSAVRCLGERVEVGGAIPVPAWGDLCQQGLPNYAGNVTYRLELPIAEDGSYALRLPRIGGALARVWCDERDCGPVHRAPWRCELDELSAGSHAIAITVFGHRRNAFGAVHNDEPGFNWWGPRAWHVQGDGHRDAWILRPTGLLRAPILERITAG